MRILLLFALALPAAPSPQRDRPAAITTSIDCRAYSRLRMADRPVKAAKATRLGDEPSAALALAVHREVGNCPEPVIVRTGIGSGR